MDKAEMTAEQHLAATVDSIADVCATCYWKGVYKERKRCAAIEVPVPANQPLRPSEYRIWLRAVEACRCAIRALEDER